MPVQINLRAQVDLPVWQYVRYAPVVSTAGTCLCTNKAGTHRYIYFLYSITSFWRYCTITDTYQQLASPGALGGSGTWGAGTVMLFDASRGAAGWIWLVHGYTTTVGFGYYDIATDTWVQRNGFGAAWGIDGQLMHTCTHLLPGANDNVLYLVGNNATVLRSFSIADNSWATTLAAAPATIGAGCIGNWASNIFSGDRIYVFRGGGTATVYYYSISGNNWITVTTIPTIETYTTGSTGIYCPDDNRIYFTRDNSHRMFFLDLATNQIIPSGSIPFIGGTVIVGDGLCYIKTADGLKFLYFRRHSATELFRTLVFW